MSSLNRPQPSVPKADLLALHQFYEETLRKVPITLSPLETERRVFLIHDALSAQTREYHGIDRIFELSRPLAPIEVLAVLYQDLIKFELDGGIPHQAAALLKEAIVLDGEKIVALKPSSARMELICDVFDVKAGQDLRPSGRMNQFLGATIAMLELGSHLNDFQFASLVAGIEATTPFDGAKPRSESCLTVGDRIMTSSQKLGIGFTRPHVDSILKSSIRVGNAAVSHFGSADPGVFLDYAWRVIPERHPGLKRRGAYTIQTYRKSLQELEDFLSTLTPELIFLRHSGTPTDDEWTSLAERTRRTQKIAIRYIQAKLVAVAILEALAELTGGDAPIIYFAGPPKVDRETSTPQLLDGLPDPKTIHVHPYKTPNDNVLHLLSRGRSAKSAFDSRKSPIAAYVYTFLGETLMDEAIAKSKEAFAAKLAWDAFLDFFPKPLIPLLADASAKFAIGRKDQLTDIAARIRRREGG